jgi:hypothetical protein
MKTKFKNVTILIGGANGELFEYHRNNEYKRLSKESIINMFDLEPLHYATSLEGKINNPKSFNTYNWNAPITLCGVANDDIYEGVAIVNIHLGGDARGNYSEPYICEDVESLFTQSTFLEIELTNGETFSFDCDNGEAHFDFETFCPYDIDFENYLTECQLTELKERSC